MVRSAATRPPRGKEENDRRQTLQRETGDLCGLIQSNETIDLLSNAERGPDFEQISICRDPTRALKLVNDLHRVDHLHASRVNAGLRQGYQVTVCFGLQTTIPHTDKS